MVLIGLGSVFAVVYRNPRLPIVVEDGSRLFVLVQRDVVCELAVGVARRFVVLPRFSPIRLPAVDGSRLITSWAFRWCRYSYFIDFAV